MPYRDDVFVLGRGRVFGILVAEAVRTARGVAIGDRLDDARAAYPTLQCREVHAGEALFGGKDPTYTLCRAPLPRKRMLVFEQDPIRSITLLDLSPARDG